LLSDHEPRGRILLAEDDEDDYLLIHDVLSEIGGVEAVTWVRDGEELLETLRNTTHDTCPDLILLDLNMPKKDGRTALKEIRADRDLRLLPIVVLTTSDADADVATSYDLGANSYIIKPSGYNEFRETMRTVVEYWFRVVNLPTGLGARESAKVR
jgi:two-component system, response regulator